MPPAKRGKEQLPEAEEPFAKKKWKPPDEPNYIAIHLDEKTRSALSLMDEEILFIQDRTYLSNIANRSSYLYDIVARICDCPIEAVTLYRQSDGELREEMDQGWQAVDPNAELAGGDYLCKCKEGPILWLRRS